MATDSIARLAGESERYIKVREEQIRVGEPLPWDVYDADNNLLLREGVTVPNEKQLERLLADGMYRRLRRVNAKTRSVAGRDPITGNASNPFSRVTEITERLEGFLRHLVRGALEDAEVRGLRLAAAVREVVDRDADAALGASHLDRAHHYVYSHALQTALLSELVGRRLKLDEDRRDAMLAATLTANIGMHQLQMTLYSQQEPLSEAQKRQIHDHPERSVALLEQAGVTSDDWLEIVRQHHERIDGGGYPHGLAGDDFILEARIIAIADRYHAMVSGREHRRGLVPRNALRKLFMEDGGAIDNTLAQIFIKEVGIFPPGSWVKLANGESGLVIRRGKTANTPTVAALRGRDGAPFTRPVHRETDSEECAVAGLEGRPEHIPFAMGYIWGYE